MQVQGKTIAITRPAEDAMEFISLMESHGGQVIPLRTIEVAASTETIGREFLSSLEKFDPDYCAFLSSKSVRVLFESAKKESMYDEIDLCYQKYIRCSSWSKNTKRIKIIWNSCSTHARELFFYRSWRDVYIHEFRRQE